MSSQREHPAVGGWDFTRESCPRSDSSVATAALPEPATSPAERPAAATSPAGRSNGGRSSDKAHWRWTGDGPFEVERVDVGSLCQAEFRERYAGFPVVLCGHCVPAHLTASAFPFFDIQWPGPLASAPADSNWRLDAHAVHVMLPRI